ncbi:hypothetical protein KP806_04810 [Paenibacillus sp. N4]|uniref:hypothetical protein n=1 Tax=Paenibacillus vietnamensis TaxID=2590547 RepID=UPI001CD09D60|nr:hypothetical protein [Paenibacillus vietnamensis]MCA0754359.1 hypothetical protein [Paenibacillus vietnamensis]
MPLKKWSAALLAICSLLLFAQLASASADFSKPSKVSAEPGQKPVQVFDIAAGKVVKMIPNDPEFQSMAAGWTGSVTGLAPQITSDPSCSYVYRVPLDKPVTVKANEITVTSDDLFLFYCKDKPPLLLMFDSERKPYLFLFSADITPFVKKVGLPAL